MVYFGNAFSLGMLVRDAQITVTSVISDEVKLYELDRNTCLKGRSIVGHADTAACLATLLRVAVAFNRESVKLVPGDTLYVAQYSGPRLPEGTTTLPEGAGFKFLRVDVDVHPVPYKD